MSNLTAYIRDCWEAAKTAKSPITAQMQRSLRQRNGIYDAGKLQSIRRMGGAEQYMLVTKSKCRDAEAWLKDILIQPGLRPWDLTPASGTLPVGTDEEVDSIFETVDRMKDRINDQFIVGGWYRAFEEFLYDVVTFKAGFIKGPILRKERLRRRVLKANKWATVIEELILPEYERRSPFDIFPSPDSTGIDDGYLIDLIRLRPSHLIDLIGVPGFNEGAIRQALFELKEGALKGNTDVDSAPTVLSAAGSYRTPEGKLTLLEFWGDVEGWMLKDYLHVEDDKVYPVCVWVVGEHVIKAMSNPDPMGLKPYSKVSFEEVPGQFWGLGLAEMLDGVQSACNAIGRAIVNNAGFASGPQVERNVERVLPGESKDMWPWKVWDVTDAQMSSTAAIRFYQPPMVVDKLMQVYEFFLRRAQEHSGIPSYVNSSSMDSAANTNASALSMSMTQAARGVKSVIKNIDLRIIAPSVERQYYFNIQYGWVDTHSITVSDVSTIPDVKVVAKGSSSLIAKEQQAIRRSEFLRTTNNPVDMAIIGAEGRRHLLKEVARALEIDVEKVIPDTPAASQRLSSAAATTPLPKVSTKISTTDLENRRLNPSGDPSGDFNLFTNSADNSVQGQGSVEGE
ncbi:MAG: hypothetical protein HQL06_08245 [Nitrospirae bacterium]|nr:hypothetical protein [Nitrospirota bacterium]